MSLRRFFYVLSRLCCVALNANFDALSHLPITVPLHHLIYSSTANINLTEAELHRLLGRWRATNASLGITGLLLFSEGEILQVLEGDAEVVHQLYAIIAADSRHRSVVKLADGAVANRAFANWSMQLRAVDETDFSRFVPATGMQREHVGNLLPLLEAFIAEAPLG